jgi:hypothetical protein
MQNHLKNDFDGIDYITKELRNKLINIDIIDKDGIK